MMGLCFFRFIVRQAQFALEAWDLITWLFVSRTIEFTAADATKFVLIDELTFPGGIPTLEYRAGFMEVESPALASITFVGCGA